MKRTLLVLGVTLAAAMPAKADMTHKIMSSISLQVGGAVTAQIGWVLRSPSAVAVLIRLTAPQQTPSQPEQSPLASTRQARLQLRKTLQAKLFIQPELHAR